MKIYATAIKNDEYERFIKYDTFVFLPRGDGYTMKTNNGTWLFGVKDFHEYFDIYKVER